MVRVITQDTYDEVVKENMDEFDMSPEEAIQEAVAQFKAQGVDLSNIIKDLALSPDDDSVSTIVMKLKEFVSQNTHDDSFLVTELDKLKAECNKDIARRVLAGKDGAYEVLMSLLETRQKMYLEHPNDKDRKMIVAVFNNLTALMEMQPDLLDLRGVDLIKNTLDKIQDEDILIALLKWTNVCCVKHEMNRQRIIAKQISENLKTLMKLRKNAKIISASMQLVRKFTLDDDIRVQFGKAHEHAKELGATLLEPLTEYLKENPVPPVVSETMLTIAALLVRHELCETVANGGVEIALFKILADNFDDAIVILQASRLITALAGNDDVKRKLMKAGIAPVIVSILNRHGSNANAGGLILKAIAALTLREPEHSKLFFDSGAPEAIVDCIKNHPDNESVQKNGCWAIRNMVARNREQNAKFHELGVEALLNSAYEKFANDFGFDIKSALRDLECDVKLEEQWTGRGTQIEN